MSDADVVGIGTHEVVTIDTFGNESDLFDLARIDESLLDERIVNLSTNRKRVSSRPYRAKRERERAYGDSTKNGEDISVRFTVGEISIKIGIVLLSENRGSSVTVKQSRGELMQKRRRRREKLTC